MAQGGQHRPSPHPSPHPHLALTWRSWARGQTCYSGLHATPEPFAPPNPRPTHHVSQVGWEQTKIAGTGALQGLVELERTLEMLTLGAYYKYRCAPPSLPVTPTPSIVPPDLFIFATTKCQVLSATSMDDHRLGLYVPSLTLRYNAFTEPWYCKSNP